MNRKYYKIKFGKSVASWEFGTFGAAKAALENSGFADPKSITKDAMIIEYEIIKRQKVVYGKENNLRSW